MGVVNKYERLEALDRLSQLHDNRCMKCPYRVKTGRSTVSEKCKRCPVLDELEEIGEILLQTSRKRQFVEEGELV